MAVPVKITSPVMTVPEVCEFLRCHRSTVYRLINQHQLPCFRVGSDFRFNREAIEEWRRVNEWKSTR